MHHLYSHYKTEFIRWSTSCHRPSFNSEVARMETTPQMARLASSYDSFAITSRSCCFTTE